MSNWVILMDDHYERPHGHSRGQQPPMPMPPPPPGFRPPGSVGYVALIIFGIIMLMVGSMIYVSWGFMDDPDSSDNDNYGKESEEYSDNIRTITTTGSIIQNIGLIILSIDLIIGATQDKNLSPNVRLGMLIAMGIIIGFGISSSYIPYYGY